MSEEHKNCKYRFKGKSCDDCPLNCKFKRLQEENKELKENIETTKADKKQFYIIANKYKQALEEIREIAKYNQFYDPRYFMIRGDIGQIQNIKMTEIYERCNKELNEK